MNELELQKTVNQLRAKISELEKERDGLMIQLKSDYKKQQEILRIYNDFPHAVFGIDPDFKIFFLNDAVTRCTGYKPSELKNTPFFNLLPDNRRDDVKEFMDSIISGGNLPDVKIVRFKKRDGGFGTAELCCLKLNTLNGAQNRCLLFFFNLDERIEKETKYGQHSQLVNEIYSNIRDGLGIVDKDEIIVTCNVAFADIFETTPNKMIGNFLLNYFDLESQQTILNQSKIRKKGLVGEYILEILVPSGKRKKISVKVSPRVNAAGEFIGSIGSVRDITEEEKLREEVKKIQELNQLVLENATDGIVLYQNQQFIYFNQTLLKMTGYSREDIAGTDVFDYLHPDEKEALKQRYIARLSGEDNLPATYRLNLRRKDGTYLLCETKVATVDYEGEIAILHMINDITERLEAEKALKESEAKYRLLVENMQDGVYLVQENEVVFANERGAEMVGLTVDEVLHTSITDYIYPEDLPIAQQYYEKRTNGIDTPAEYEVRFVHKDGSLRYVTLHVSAAEYKGKPASLGTVKDTTELVRMFRELETQKHFQETILNAVPSLIVMKDRERKYRLVNEAFINDLHLSNSDVIGKLDDDFQKPDRALQERQTDHKVMSTEEPHSYENFYQDANGKKYFYYTSKVPFFDKDGKISGIVGSTIDITGRKIAEDRLKQVHQIYYQAIENADGVPYYLNFETRKYDYVGDRCSDLFGIDSKKITPALIHDMSKEIYIVDENAPQNIYDYARAFLEQKVDNYRVVIKFYLENGQVKWVSDSAIPVVSNDRVVASVGILIDITDSKEAEMELRDLNAAKDKFFSIIAHDLRNPFNALTGLSEFVVHNIEKLEVNKIRQFTHDIYRSSKEVYELITNLLQWSRVQTGRMQFDPTLGSLFVFCEATINLVQSQAMKKDISIDDNISPELRIYADRNMFDLILRNLLTNAIKFSHPKGKVELIAELEKDRIRISVIDRGVGMSQEKIEKLFRIEEHVSESGTANESGTGLGLILVSEFVKLHKGTISVESRLGEGTTVSFTMPLNDKLFK